MVTRLSITHGVRCLTSVIRPLQKSSNTEPNCFEAKDWYQHV